MSWYEAKTGNHQGLIVDEKTGANIAVAYDKAHAPLLASAPSLLEVAERAGEGAIMHIAEIDAAYSEDKAPEWIEELRCYLVSVRDESCAAIHKAEGRS